MALQYVPYRWGRLPYEYRDSVKIARTVVYSYSTPIAWVTEDGEIICPDLRYSVTTSNHQNLARAWLALETGRNAI